MNRYRSLPGLGPPKATPSTTCQKCLKRGHYSYECKASLQERPYAARPSRSMVLKDPGLARGLESDKVKSSVEIEGVVDQVLKEAEARRNRDEEGKSKGFSGEGRSRSPGSRRRSKLRSRSRSRSESVETISTDRDRDRSTSPKTHGPVGNRRGSGAEKKIREGERPPSQSRARKRRYDSVSSLSESRSPPPHPSQRKNRRHRTVSPHDRGRPFGYRRGSRRSRSGSIDDSMDKSRITKQRRSLSDQEEYEAEIENRDPGRTRKGDAGGASHGRWGEKDPHSHRREAWEEPDRRRHEKYVQRDAGRGKRGDADGDGLGNGDAGVRGRDKPVERREGARKGRSLSPYSRRLALTQAMNVGR